jgi:hypothetical protein
MFNISPAPARFAKRASKAFSSANAHILVLASTVLFGLKSLDAALVIGHVRPVDRTQRHAHRCGNRRLRHPTLAQQHHLNASKTCCSPKTPVAVGAAASARDWG